jgi:uncharacterized membrane protein
MSPLAAIFLFLHVLGAIVAFGPTFVFPVIGRVAAREPRFGPAIITANIAIEKGLIIPVGLFQAVTGLGLILTVGFNPFDSATHWLLAGIILYILAFTILFTVQYPTGEKLLHMVQSAPAGPPPAGAPAGPPPAMMALIKRSQQTGMVLSVLLVLIVFCMAVKPSF